MFANQFFPAVAQPLAGLAVNVENGPMFVKQKEGISRVIHEGAKARLARAQFAPRLPQFRNVLQDAKLAQRPPQFVPRHVALAVNYPLRTVGTDDAVFNVIAWTATNQRSGGGFVHSRPVLRVYQLQPLVLPLWQIDRLHSEYSAGLV